MKFKRVISCWLWMCFALMTQAMPAFAQQPPLPPPPPLLMPPPNAGMGMHPPPGWPDEFRRPRNPEDMRLWQQHEGEGMPPPDWHHRHMSPDEQQSLRRDLNRARREIYRDWRAWPLPPPTLPPERAPHHPPD